MEASKILVVEDDLPVRNLITTTLKMHGYSYLQAKNGEEALMLASSHNPSILLLDLGLPDMDGIDVIRSVRTWSSMPVLRMSEISVSDSGIRITFSAARVTPTSSFFSIS